MVVVTLCDGDGDGDSDDDGSDKNDCHHGI
jgi:hypothetical protein